MSENTPTAPAGVGASEEKESRFSRFFSMDAGRGRIAAAAAGTEARWVLECLCVCDVCARACVFSSMIFQ